MDALTILRRCRSAEDEIALLEQRIAQRWDVLNSIGAPQLDPNGGSRAGGAEDKVPRIMAEIDQLERARDRRIEAKNAELTAASALVDMVPPLEGKVLHMYYVMRMSTPDIAREEHYQPGYLRKVKRRAEALLGMLGQEQVEATVPAWYLREREEDGEE